MTKIKKCFCTSKYQDKKYGKGHRVFNGSLKYPDKWVCTVCGKTAI